MEKQTVYVVQQIRWEYSDEWFYRNGDEPIKAFTRRAIAEAHRREQEQTVREELMNISPVDEERDWPNYWSSNILYTFGSLESISSLTEETFRAKVQEIGLPDFPFEQFYVNAGPIFNLWNNDWWINAWEALKPDRTDLLWNLFDRLFFFEVVEMEVEA